MLRNRFVRVAAILIVLAALPAGAYAFTAQNTVNTSIAGDGSGDVSAFTATVQHYTINPSNPTQFNGVTFTLNGTANQAWAKIAGGSWAQCSVSARVWSCAVDGSILNATTNALEISAVQ
jgi:hypothetical protein